jgi:hypothetical protein
VELQFARTVRRQVEEIMSRTARDNKRPATVIHRDPGATLRYRNGAALPFVYTAARQFGGRSE